MEEKSILANIEMHPSYTWYQLWKYWINYCTIKKQVLLLDDILNFRWVVSKESLQKNSGNGQSIGDLLGNYDQIWEEKLWRIDYHITVNCRKFDTIVEK